jgi:hypothetical protein
MNNFFSTSNAGTIVSAAVYKQKASIGEERKNELGKESERVRLLDHIPNQLS